MGESNYVRMTFSFTENDKDVIEHLEKLKKSGKASEYVREAVREKMKNDMKGKEDSLENTIREIVKEVLSEHQTLPPHLQNNNYNQHNVEQQDDDLNNAVLNAIDSFDF